MKVSAVLLYGMNGITFSAIGRLPDVSDVAILNWVRAKALALPEPAASAAVVTVEVNLSLRSLHHLQDPANYAA